MPAPLAPKLRRLPLAGLIPYPGNPRRGNVKAIAESLRTNGQFAPIVVSSSTNRILSGNHTAEAARSLGWAKIDAYVVVVDEQQEKRIVAAANRTADLASYDDQALVALLQGIDDLDGTGYVDDDLDRLLAAMETSTVREHQRRAPTPHEPGEVRIIHGDSLVELANLADESVDAVVTDPPYGLDFMGKAWDRFTADEFEAWCARWATECLRILKPGGHLLAFGGTRTAHRLTAGIEDAGFEIRDAIAWLYGSGFPKSLDVSKAIDREAGAKRKVVGTKKSGIAVPGEGQRYTIGGSGSVDVDVTEPATDEARKWDGWGTALKPAFEPITIGRKPIEKGSIARNVVDHGTGALNLDATRVGPEEDSRWPANVVVDEAAGAALAEQAGQTPFFYTAKAATSEKPFDDEGASHPTVKPLAIMRWLIRLVTPPGGLVLDPFAGSGTTAEAAVLEGMRAIVIERDDAYLDLIRRRVAEASAAAG